MQRPGWREDCTPDREGLRITELAVKYEARHGLEKMGAGCATRWYRSWTGWTGTGRCRTS